MGFDYYVDTWLEITSNNYPNPFMFRYSRGGRYVHEPATPLEMEDWDYRQEVSKAIDRENDTRTIYSNGWLITNDYTIRQYTEAIRAEYPDLDWNTIVRIDRTVCGQC